MNLGYYCKYYRYYFCKLPPACQNVASWRHDETPCHLMKLKQYWYASLFHMPINHVHKILLNCMLTSYDEWNENCDIVTERHDRHCMKCMQLPMLWYFLIKQPKQPYINRQWIICLVHLRANINEVSFLTSYSHVSDVTTSDFWKLASRKTIETKNNNFSISSTGWDKCSMFFDVMTWGHDVMSSCKYKTDNIVELSNQKYQKKNKNHLSSTSTSLDR